MERKITRTRLSKLQKTILQLLINRKKKMDYKELRDETIHQLRISWAYEDSFKASFSRSLKNLKAKHLIKRVRYGWYLGRISLVWDDISLTKRGMTNVVSYCK